MNHAFFDLVIELCNLFFINTVERDLSFEIDLEDIAHGGVCGVRSLSEFDDLTDTVVEISSLAASEECAECGVLFAGDLFGTEEVAFEEFDRGFGEGADGTFLGKEAREELIDEGVDGVAGLGLELNDAVSGAGEFAQGLNIGEEVFVGRRRNGFWLDVWVGMVV